ncbi:unnamed protein product [Aspergillus oryzae RIB40]|uniref:DNA, SC111 n=2 Tax=Aspergillus oryzae TaxID=5062 RepID=Q2U871_ASPOR|nr:unnamed protein product [Aspergillus oryzae RIB40]KJJ30906.1 hypothetical protein AFLA70_362g001340 [Aspergillus flavus AF70]OOO06247.1 hypothetical protein OAory_01019080 [Aspergillus oryzae]BAE62244.1 unnamed protein product [Aspergillus oryzae RIB40]
MAAATTNFSRFPRFTSLPPELRYLIWRCALPDNIGQVLFPYKKGCWGSRHLSESDEEYTELCNTALEFRHSLLGPVQFDIPLFFVNRESRAFALAWVREMGIEMRFHRDKQSFVFMRQLDLVRDVLYIPFDKVDEFIQEPLDRQFEPDLFARMVDWHPNVKHIAVPEALLQSDSSALREIFDLFYHPKTFFIVVDAQPDWHESNINVHQRWELDSMLGRGFFWNSKHGRFVCETGLSIGDEALYQRIERAIDDLASLFTPSHPMDDFEIRPVFVIRK